MEKRRIQGEILNRAMADKEIAVVILTEKFGQDYPELINEARLSHSLPLLLRDSGPSRYDARREFYHLVCNEAVGVKL